MSDGDEAGGAYEDGGGGGEYEDEYLMVCG